MDSAQYNLILASVTLSFNPLLLSTMGEGERDQTKRNAMKLLDDFKNSDRSIEASFQILQSPTPHVYTPPGQNTPYDSTPPMKLYALLALLHNLPSSYPSYKDNEKLQYRQAILSYISSSLTPSDPSTPVIQPQLSRLLSQITLLSFPSSWPTYISDLTSLLSSSRPSATVGWKSFIATIEDCCDGDFNIKIPQARRNDVLQGLHEISSQLLSLLHSFLDHHYKQHLASNDESTELLKLGLEVCCTLCKHMPVGWTLPDPNAVETSTTTASNPDFLSIYLHLLRESKSDVNLLAAKSLSNLTSRKLPPYMWERVIFELPTKLSEAQRILDGTVSLTGLLPLHREMSTILSSTISNNVAKITENKRIVPNPDPGYPLAVALNAFLDLMVQLMAHPVPEIGGRMINTWVLISRDPGIQKGPIISSRAQSLLEGYLKGSSKIDWDKVEDGSHSFAELYEEVWGDVEDYENWLMDIKGKLGILVRIVSYIASPLALTFLHKALASSLPTLDASSSLPIFADNVMQGAFKGQGNNVDAESIKIAGEIATILMGWETNSEPKIVMKIGFLESLSHYFSQSPASLPTSIMQLLNFLSYSPTDPLPEPVPPQVVVIRRKSGTALVSLGKANSHSLVQYVSELSTASSELLASNKLLPPQRIHLIEFLTCVSSAIQDHQEKTNFVASILAEPNNILTSDPTFHQMSSSPNGILQTLQIMPPPSLASITDPATVTATSKNFAKVFMAMNQLLSVGKRCDERAKSQLTHNLPEEAIPLSTLSTSDPFVPIWPSILSPILSILNSTIQIWTPSIRATLLNNELQRYALALSDEEAVVATQKTMEEVQTSGLVIKNTNKRKINLVPRWGGWLNELHNCPLQLLGLLASQRALYCPEIQHLYPNVISTFSDSNLKSMEHRHFIQLLKQFVEPLIYHTPLALYSTYLTTILGTILDHARWRLACTWKVINGKVGSVPPSSSSSSAAATDCSSGQGSDTWLETYYSYCGLFVGDLDETDSEAITEKIRTELSHCWADMVQSALALKGDWALTLANIAKEKDLKHKGHSKAVPGGYVTTTQKTNADGTIRTAEHEITEQLKTKRIDAMSHYLLFEPKVAAPLVQTAINLLSYPDAHTTRRCIKICHRVLENCAHIPEYANLFSQMFTTAVNQIVTEPKWMVGVEWDVIALIRDLYCRLVLGQALLPGGQGPGLQCEASSPLSLNSQVTYTQHRNVSSPRDGGGILPTPSDLPRHTLANLPGSGVEAVKKLEKHMTEKRAAKDQKNTIKDFLSRSASIIKKSEREGNRGEGVFGRAKDEESVLTLSDQVVKPQALASSKKKKKKKKGADAGVQDGDLGNLYGDL
mmetsp:Transcript_14279/g.29330  ORF Transcript_14279/g.29330 Transcript_14279/m.29330 type:complete len:1346 (-) Transcript_14279:24-4061(-)